MVAMPYRLGRSGSGAIALHTILWAEEHHLLRKAYVASKRRISLHEELRDKICGLLPLPYLNAIPNNWTSMLFDSFVSRKITHGDVFYGLCGSAGISLRRANKLGLKKIIDSQHTHTLTSMKLLGDEMAELGMIATIETFRKAWVHAVRRILVEYRLVDYVTVPSKLVYDTFIENGFPEDRLRLVYYGVDTSRFTPASESDYMFRVLFVGVNKLRKGLRYLLMAWRKFENCVNSSAELVVCGRTTPAERRLMEPFYRGLRNVRRIEYAPNLVELYRSSSVFALPSLDDAFGLVVSEAMACGLPCIVSETTGSKDLVVDGGGGFIVPPADSKAILEALIYLYHNPKELRRMGQKARSTAEHYSWEHYRENLTRAYAELL